MRTIGLPYWQAHTNCRLLDGKVDDRYWLEENINDPPGEGNVTLMMGQITEQPNTRVLCIGGVDCKPFTQIWTASIDTPLDEETDSDSVDIFTGDRAAAIEVLWERRFEAYY